MIPFCFSIEFNTIFSLEGFIVQNSLNSQKIEIIKGVFCISLDFEKFWGIHDIVEWQKKEEELIKVRSVVTELLELFNKHGIHATWATVGLLACKNKEELIEKTSPIKIPYQNQNYSPFPINDSKYKGIPFEIINANEEITQIIEHKHQELASHTFSHYYCLEAGQNQEGFSLDMRLMNDLESQLNLKFKSIVFPRNQINSEYLRICEENKYTAYRGNQKNKDWSNSQFENESILKKGKRYLDAYYNITRTEACTIHDLEKKSGMLNIPASRFFRPFSGKKYLESLKLKRIKEEMKSSAVNGNLYHLWWHPHNFSQNREDNFRQIEEILLYYKELKDKYEFNSLNMGEIADYVTK